jgi:hypothetical protein
MNNEDSYLTISGKYRLKNRHYCSTCKCTGKSHIPDINKPGYSILIDCPECTPDYDKINK